MTLVAEVTPIKRPGAGRRVRDRGRSAVLGLVEEAMRSLIDRGVKPTVLAISCELGHVGSNSIRRARAELVASGIVRVPDGLERMVDDLGPGALDPEEVRERAARVLAERAARARGFRDPDLFPPPPTRPSHEFKSDVKRVLGAERRIVVWAAAGRGREASR